MQASSVIEIYTSVLGWHINNNIWALLEQTGLFLIPFIVIVIRNLIKAREQKDKNDIGVLAFRLSEVQFYVMFFTILLLIKPTINLNHEAVNYTDQLCTTDTSQSSLVPEKKAWGDTGSTFDSNSKYIEASLDGQALKIPILWYPLEFYMRAFTESTKHALPCKPDLRTMSGDLAAARVLDPLLRDETQQFYRDCWRPSANRFLRDKPTVDADIYPNIEEDVSWVGSQFFNQHPYYYHRDRPREALSSFPYVEARDNMIVTENYSQDRGWPFCAEWWTSGEYGLRERLLEHFNGTYQGQESETLSERFSRLSAQLGSLTGNDELEDTMLKMLLRSDLRIQNLALTNNYTRDQAGGVVNAVTGGLSETLIGFGMLKQNAGHSVEMHTYQFAAPVVQALILMLITLTLPILAVVSLYRLEVVFALLMLKFSVIFWGFLFQLAFWLDNFLLEGLLDHSNADGFIGSLGSFVGDYDPTVNLINYITRMMYILLPVAFSSLMTLAGYRSGQGLNDAVESQGRAGASGGKSTTNQLQDSAVKGIGK